LVSHEKLAYDLALQYAAAKCTAKPDEADNPDEVCKNMIEDFALAYKTMSKYSEETFKYFLHDDE